MKIEIKIKPVDWEVGDDRYIVVESVWDEDTIINIQLPSNKTLVDGCALIDAIRRCIGRTLYQRD